MTTGPSRSYLKPEDVRKLGNYEFAPKAFVEGYFSGRHRSDERGTSTEFQDYRAYVPGDDPRRVDWRVFARTEKYYLRNYHQESTMACQILLDASGSMGFGSGITKLEYASFFAAALCYLVVRGGDQVSLGIFDDKLRTWLPPGSTGRHLQHCLSELESTKCGGETGLGAVLEKFSPVLRQRGSLIILSDFLDDPAHIFSAMNAYLHRGFRLYLFQILAPEEVEMGDLGFVNLEDAETGHRITTHADSVRSAYREVMENHIRAIRELARRRQVHHQLARTDTHYFQLFDSLVAKGK